MIQWRRYDDDHPDHPDHTGPPDHRGETLYWVTHEDGDVAIARFNDYVWDRPVGHSDSPVKFWAEIEYPDPPAAWDAP